LQAAVQPYTRQTSRFQNGSLVTTTTLRVLYARGL